MQCPLGAQLIEPMNNLEEMNKIPFTFVVRQTFGVPMIDSIKQGIARAFVQREI